MWYTTSFLILLVSYSYQVLLLLDSEKCHISFTNFNNNALLTIYTDI